MIQKKITLLVFATIVFIAGCGETVTDTMGETKNQTAVFEQEKKAIIQTLNDETKAAFQRDYEGWKEKWVHDPTITKTYLNFADSTFSESIGWNEINSFVKTYIEEHPDPDPLPKLIDNIDVRLYGNGAWVTYDQQDSTRGLKREIRLMEKVNGQWKIAGMQTTIYGFKNGE